MNKITKTARTLDTFFKIVYRLYITLNLIIWIPLGFIFLFLILGAPELLKAISAGLVNTLRFGSASFTLSPDVSAAAADVGIFYLVAGLIIGLLGLVLAILSIRCVRRILAPMKEGLPFAREVAENFQKLGWLTILGGVLDLVMELVLDGSLIRAYDLGALFLSDKITAVNVNYVLDFSFVLLALILFGLSYVFRYGQELQQLSDETL